MTVYGAILAALGAIYLVKPALVRRGSIGEADISLQKMPARKLDWVTRGIGAAVFGCGIAMVLWDQVWR